MLNMYESDSNESSNTHSSMPELIPRVADSDSSSDKESNWMSTTEELTDDESVISHEIEAQNENIIQIGNIRVVRSRQMVQSMALPMHEGPGGGQEWVDAYNCWLQRKMEQQGGGGEGIM